jgi:SAM-dependent methyltransferase
MMHINFKRESVQIPTECPVCRSIGAFPRLTVDRIKYGVKSLDMAECGSCGTLYFTSESPVIGYDFPGFEEEYWLNYVQSGAGISAMLEPLLAVAPKKGGKLLDVGCGFGFVPHFWESSGYGSAVGLETSLYGKIGHEKLGVTIHSNFYSEAAQIAGEKFDYVYSSEVIEHVPDPAAFIDEISAALAPDGILILTTPCADAVKPGSPYQDTIAVLSPGFHYFVASERALLNLLKQRGFAHVKIQNSGNRLFAWASHVPLPKIAGEFGHWDEYYQYLETLSRNTDLHVAGGALYRLVKDSVNRGRSDIAGQAVKRWAALSRIAYGLDLLDPVKITERFLRAESPRNSEFPSWMGCGLLFYARAVMLMGAEPRLLVKSVQSAIAAMKREIEVFAQFAQEPAYFLKLAEDTLKELKRAESSPLAIDIKCKSVRGEPGSLKGKSVVLLCGYAPDGRPSPALLSLNRAFASHGLDVHICLAVSPFTETIETSGLEQATTVSMRHNDSFDFGIWASQLNALPEIWDAERIIFANDSVILVNDDAFSSMMDSLQNDESEFIALTESNSPCHHSQSYFFQIQGTALHDWRLRSFWAGVKSGLDKDAVINNYELTMMRTVQQNQNLRAKVLFGFQNLFPNGFADGTPVGNASHYLWERLLMKGMPFVKAELLHRNPMNLPLMHWRNVLEDIGADLEMVDRHLLELSRVRGGYQPKRKTQHVVLGHLLGNVRFEQMRQKWNRRRLSRRARRRTPEPN